MGESGYPRFLVGGAARSLMAPGPPERTNVDNSDPSKRPDDDVVFVYTSEQAVRGDLKMRLGERLWCTTNWVPAY
jgi:hypothetical protein